MILYHTKTDQLKEIIMMNPLFLSIVPIVTECAIVEVESAFEKLYRNKHSEKSFQNRLSYTKSEFNKNNIKVEEDYETEGC